MLAYFLKINVAIALFYAFYRLFFYKDTFFTWRRVALLCFFAVSAVYPLLNIQTWITEQEPMVAMADLYADIVLPEFTLTPEKATFDWKAILLQTAGFVYWGGVALLAARFLMQLAGIIRLAFRSRKTKIGDTNVHLLKQADGPFSFFHWIFVHPASHTEEELSEILTHEQAHANQWHSIDVLISEAACVLCWFNPFAWLMKREIRTNLEYLADNRVLETGHDSKSYQYHLLGLSHYKAAATIYNSFNVLPLKKRIKMMNKKRTREIGRTKYLMFLPLAALLMIISNIEAVARTTKEMAKEIVRNDALDRVYMALDYFDASINRVLALATGFRSWQKALLTALCTPNEMLKELQDTNQLGKLMVMHEAVKMLPIGEIWEEYCRREGVCDDLHFYDEIERYEREVLTKRG